MVIAALGHGPKALPGLANDPCLNPVIVIFYQDHLLFGCQKGSTLSSLHFEPFRFVP